VSSEYQGPPVKVKYSDGKNKKLKELLIFVFQLFTEEFRRGRRDRTWDRGSVDILRRGLQWVLSGGKQLAHFCNITSDWLSLQYFWLFNKNVTIHKAI